MVYAATTQIIYRYDSQYILFDSHGRINNMRDWDSLQVPALAYDSLVWMKLEQSCHTNWTLNLLVGVMKKTLASMDLCLHIPFFTNITVWICCSNRMSQT